MNDGYLNLRTDDLLNKLDSTPREDIDKLKNLLYETNTKKFSKSVSASLNAIEENVLSLDSLNTDANKDGDSLQKPDSQNDDGEQKPEPATQDATRGVGEQKPDTETATQKTETQNDTFNKILKNLDNEGNNFINCIEKLYKILFIPYSKEVVIGKKLDYITADTADTADTAEYVNNRILGRILYNIHYFEKYSRVYPLGEFRSLILKIKDGLRNKKLNDTEINSKLNKDINSKLIKDSNTTCIDEIDEIYNSYIIHKIIDEGGNIEIVKTNTNTNTVENVLVNFNASVSTELTKLKALEAEDVADVKKDVIKSILKLIAYNAACNIINNPHSIVEKVDIVATIVSNMKTLLIKLTQQEKHEYIKTLNLHFYIFTEFENKVDFIALEVYYGIIYGSTLRYDLKMLEENEYIIERLERLDKTYETIKFLVCDETFRTLKKAFIKKNPGTLNIFRIDEKELHIIKPLEDVKNNTHNVIKKYTEQEEYQLRNLVILNIENGGNINIKMFKAHLRKIYDLDDEYKAKFDIISLSTYGIIAVKKYIKYYENKKAELETVKLELTTLITTLITLVEEAKLETVNLELTTLITNLNPLVDRTKLLVDRTNLLVDDTNLEGNKLKLNEILAELKNNIDIIKNNVNKALLKLELALEISLNKKKSDTATDDSGQTLPLLLKEILLPDHPDDNTTKTDTDTILKILAAYKRHTKKIGGSYENRIIDAPVTQTSTNCVVLPSELKTIEASEEENIKSGGYSGAVAIKREELKEALENVNFNDDDDVNESFANNSKRQFTELTAKFQNFLSKPINVKKDDTKLLDDEYIEQLHDFDIKEIKSSSYAELRKKLYSIKNSEYLEDIKITNEDIYIFIVTTYILRVISLYITMWFIQIEIIKDVESVIICYIFTYILLFILIYTFVNLSDNKLDNAKSYLYYFYSRVNFSYTRFIVHLGLLCLLIVIPFIIRTVDKEDSTYKNISDTEKRYLYTFITNMSTIVWVILSIIAFFFK